LFLLLFRKIQRESISDAIMLAEDFAKDDKLLVVLGDNIFGFDLKSEVDKLIIKNKGAMCFG